MPRGWAAHWFPSSGTAPGTGRELRKHEVNEWRGLRVGVLVLLLEALLPGVGVGGRGVPGMGPCLEALLVPRPCLVFSSPFPVLEYQPAGTEALGFRAKRSCSRAVCSRREWRVERGKARLSFAPSPPCVFLHQMNGFSVSLFLCP